MLKSYLTSPPYQKFIIIEDTLTENGKPIFDYLLQHHLDHFHNKIHYYLVQGKEQCCPVNAKITVHNLKTNSQNWDSGPRKDVNQLVSGLQKRDIIFVDSLAHCIFQYGLAETYRLFNILKNEVGVTQVVTLLHIDLLDAKWNVLELFNFLCTLSMKLQPKFSSDYGRIQYQCKKSGGRVVKQIEEYYFESGKLETKKIDKPDPKKMLESASKTEINPDDLSTFKISLTDKEKESRSQLILPYLPNYHEISDYKENMKPVEEIYKDLPHLNNILNGKDYEVKTFVPRHDPRSNAVETIFQAHTDAVQDGRRACRSILNEDNSTEGGQIYYKFDEQDDWDEEDPDDDLDI